MDISPIFKPHIGDFSLIDKEIELPGLDGSILPGCYAIIGGPASGKSTLAKAFKAGQYIGTGEPDEKHLYTDRELAEQIISDSQNLPGYNSASSAKFEENSLVVNSLKRMMYNNEGSIGEKGIFTVTFTNLTALSIYARSQGIIIFVIVPIVRGMSAAVTQVQFSASGFFFLENFTVSYQIREVNDRAEQFISLDKWLEGIDSGNS